MAKNRKILLEKLIEDPSFQHWVNGDNSPESQEWDYHHQNNPQDREVMDQARLIVGGVPFNQRYIPQQKVDTAWRRLERSMEVLPEIPPSSGVSLKPIWKIAVAVLLLILGGGVAYSVFQNSNVHYHTDYGQRMEIQLPDGTTVTMNANSTLSYVRKNPRGVTMSGEMYFDVEKKPETGAPFIVSTPDLNIQVLGTEFNVNSRQRKTEVLLDEGSIVLDMKKQGRMLMKPGDLVSFSASENKILEQQVAEKPEVITSWKEGVLMLDSVSLEATLSLLEDTYNVTTVFENQKMGDKILVGGVPNDDLETCIRALQTIYNLDITLSRDSLIVK